MNRDVKRRDEIIFGEYWSDRYKFGGCSNTEINFDQLKQLVEEDFINLNECQNDSPSTKEFISFADGYENNVIFEIYAISPDRDDYRVTIEGIQITIPIDKRDDLCNFMNNFRYADEFNIDSDEDNYFIRAWWD